MALRGEQAVSWSSNPVRMPVARSSARRQRSASSSGGSPGGPSASAVATQRAADDDRPSPAGRSLSMRTRGAVRQPKLSHDRLHIGAAGVAGSDRR